MQHRTIFMTISLLAFGLSCTTEQVTTVRHISRALADAGVASEAPPDAGGLAVNIQTVTEDAVPGDAPPEALASEQVPPEAAPTPPPGDAQPGGSSVTGTGSPGYTTGPDPIRDAGVPASDAGAGVPVELPLDCTGCARLAVRSNRIADYQLAFDGARDLSGSRILWRVRVRNTAGSVDVTAYAQNDAGDEVSSGIRTLTAAQGWQEISLELGAGSSADAGVSANVELGAFDPTQVGRLGLALQPALLPGEFGAAVLELDSARFSSSPELDADFASDGGGFVLVDSVGASVTYVPE